MDVDELLETLANQITQMGCDQGNVLTDLNQHARRQMTRILDKYSRFIPFDSAHCGLVLQQVQTEGNAVVAHVAIETQEGRVPAAVIRYEPAAGAADEFHT